jgi:hypothetical protein
VPRIGRGRSRTRPDKVRADKAYGFPGNRAYLRRRGSVDSTIVGPVPRPVPLRHVAPRGTGSGPPPYAVYQLPPGPHRWTARLFAPRQQRLKPSPLVVRQISTPHGR